MDAVFLKILNLSIISCWLVLAVLAVRLICRRAPRWIFCLLWGLVAFRLVCPVSVKSALSLIPSKEIIPVDELYTESTQPSDTVRLNIVNNPSVGESVTLRLDSTVESARTGTAYLSVIWISGAAAMLIYAVFSFLLLKRRVSTATLLQKGVKQSEFTDSPFVLGILHPVIYIPYNISDCDLGYVIAHEQAHIRRKDHWWKPLGFVLLSVHWFNPLLWLAYILLCRDIEAACDEKVVKNMSRADRRAYSTALLNCSIHRRRIAACPLAFGEVGVKARIKGVMDYKKPAFWMIILSVAVLIITAVCLLTDPAGGLYAPEPFCHSYRVAEIVYDAPQYSFSYSVENAPRYSLTSDYEMFVSGDRLDTLESNSWLGQGGFREVDLSPLIFDDYFKIVDDTSGWQGTAHSPESIRISAKAAWRLDVEGDESNVFYYLILTDDGLVYLTYGYDVGDSHAANEPGSLIRWVFRLERIDLLSCSAMSKNCNSYIEPTYYPAGFDWDYEVLSSGIINESGTLVFSAEWDTDVLKVSEDYYTTGAGGTVIERKTYELPQSSDGKFRLDVALRGQNGDEALYFIQGETGTYVMKIVFADDEAVLTDTQAATVPRLSPGTTYVSWQCLYMNPLSSYAAIGGDSGYKYEIRDDHFAVISRSGDSVVDEPGGTAVDTASSGGERTVRTVEVSNWAWQTFPYTGEEWTALYKPVSFGSMDITQAYDQLLYQPLTDEEFLLYADGNILLAELKSDPRMGVYLWSIYSLVPEAAMGVAQWEFAPYLSSRSPEFIFELDFDCTELTAACSEGTLSIDGTDKLRWSPISSGGTGASRTSVVFFAVTDTAVYSGTLYISGVSRSGSGTIYTATIVGTGLHLSPNTQSEGGVISVISTGINTSGADEAVVKHDLTTGEIELTAAQLKNYVFYTNSTQISVSVEGNAPFAGTVTLVDISQNNAQVRLASVDSKKEEALFTGLTSSRLYRIEGSTLGGCTFIISGE